VRRMIMSKEEGTHALGALIGVRLAGDNGAIDRESRARGDVDDLVSGRLKVAAVLALGLSCR
jgi:hypothetical protein